MVDTVWGIHGGRHGAADRLFRERSVIALGWNKLAGLSALKPDRDDFKRAVAEAYADKKPMAVANNAGQLFRFVHKMAVGDFVVYPSQVKRRIYVGKVTAEYVYDISFEPAYGHRRPVEWLDDFPRTRFSQGALHESGSLMSFFKIRNHSDEFLDALRGVPHEEVPEDEDETVSLVAEEIEATTGDFVLKRLARELKGHPFAQFVADLMEAMGYRTRVSPPGPDRGVDIVASRDELGLEPPIIKVQAKSSEGSVGGPEVSQHLGVLADGEFGLFVTLGTFSSQARSIAAGKANLRLVDGYEVVSLTLDHYDQLDIRYKGIIPLKRVFIPEGIEP